VPLEQELLEVVRRDAEHERLVVEPAAPAAAVDTKRGVEVLGDGVCREPADLLEGASPDDAPDPHQNAAPRWSRPGCTTWKNIDRS
jgi:hypothetical protein